MSARNRVAKCFGRNITVNVPVLSQDPSGPPGNGERANRKSVGSFVLKPKNRARIMKDWSSSSKPYIRTNLRSYLSLMLAGAGWM